MEQAFNATWTVLQARDPLRDFEQHYELKTALNRKLMLREWALEGPSKITANELEDRKQRRWEQQSVCNA